MCVCICSVWCHLVLVCVDVFWAVGEMSGCEGVWGSELMWADVWVYMCDQRLIWRWSVRIWGAGVWFQGCGWVLVQGYVWNCEVFFFSPGLQMDFKILPSGAYHQVSFPRSFCPWDGWSSPPGTKSHPKSGISHRGLYLGHLPLFFQQKKQRRKVPSLRSHSSLGCVLTTLSVGL